MKLPKDRKLTPLLRFQLIQQEKRIKQCGLEAYLDWYSPFEFREGSYFSTRFKR